MDKKDLRGNPVIPMSEKELIDKMVVISCIFN